MKIAMIMIVVMAVVLGGFYWYYQDSQKKLAVLQENNAKLEVSVQTQKETIADSNNCCSIPEFINIFFPYLISLCTYIIN